MTDRIPLDHLTSDQYDQLCDELDRARTELQRHAEAESADAAAGSYAGRAEQAEAALARIRGLVDECEARGHDSGHPLTVTRVRAALDEVARPDVRSPS